MSDVESRSVVAIARKDFDDAVRSKMLWLLGVLFVVVLGGMAAVPLLLSELVGQGPDVFQNFATADYLRFIQGPISWFFPVIGLLLGFKSIAGEIQSGTGKIVHTLPHTRLDVILGKFVGRTVILWATLAVGLVVALLVSLAFYDSADAVLFLRFSLLSMLYSAAWVSVGVGLSALTRSTSIATALAVGTFLFFYFVYDALRFGLLWVVNGGIPIGGENPTWYTVLGILTPGSAYNLTLPSGLGQQRMAGNTLDAVYTSPEAGLVILFGWIVLPLTIGYLRFARVDL